ncbi:MAG: site-specific integrase [candidate division Zixibacteria bacterium]|nr:site-specific integrase [candidate division Zixibacteria bacterium]
MKININNEKLKRRYIKRLREASGFSESTICSVEKAIWLYEDFARHNDYEAFSQTKAINFKKWLCERKRKGKSLSTTTIYHHLRHLKSFFSWLSGQPGYKSKINLDTVSYLTLEKKKVREALTPKAVKFPSLEYVKRLTDSIKIETEIDRRDRALIAFLLLSGMRDKAISTLPLGCFDQETLEIIQDPQKGVETKFGKLIHSTLLQFDDQLVSYVTKWHYYLLKEKLYAPTSPFFPRNKIEQIKGGLTFTSLKVEPHFWKSAGRIREILKKRSSTAGLDYYQPHSFRHAAIHIAMKNCRNAEQMKAISQNFGHQFVGTTLLTYGNLDEYQVKEVISTMSFNPSEENQNQKDEINKAIKILTEAKNKA